MNPSPRTRSAIYLLLAITDVVVFVFTFMTRQYNPDVITALIGLNGVVLSLANANVQK